MNPLISSIVLAESLRSSIPWREFNYAILESPSEICFVSLAAAEPERLNPEAFSSGTLFSENAELRWRRRRDGRFHLVMVHDAGLTLKGEIGIPLEPLANSTKGTSPPQLLLWKPVDEPRIPRSIGYPSMPAGKRPSIALKHYRLREETSPATDPLVITRYVI
jgi:hypothetical protein